MRLLAELREKEYDKIFVALVMTMLAGIRTEIFSGALMLFVPIVNRRDDDGGASKVIKTALTALVSLYKVLIPRLMLIVLQHSVTTLILDFNESAKSITTPRPLAVAQNTSYVVAGASWNIVKDAARREDVAI